MATLTVLAVCHDARTQDDVARRCRNALERYGCPESETYTIRDWRAKAEVVGHWRSTSGPVVCGSARLADRYADGLLCELLFDPAAYLIAVTGETSEATT